jgi:hypothetical protein
MDDTQAKLTEKQNRPILVWFAAIYYFASTLLPFLSIMINETARNHFLSQSAFQYLIIFPVPVLNLAGAVLLLLLRKYSFHTLVVALGLDILKTLYTFSFTNYIDQASHPVLVILRLVVSWTICVVVIMYARFLMKKGVLQ